MSATILTYEGYSGLMGACVAAIASGANGSRVRLYGNDFNPTRLTLWHDFTEASFPGYAAIPVPAAIDQGITALMMDVWDFAKVTFTMSSTPAQVVYGYWIDFSNPLTHLRQSLWCKRFDAPFLFNAAGVALPLTLTPGFRQG
jgi:hypothetical protein